MRQLLPQARFGSNATGGKQGNAYHVLEVVSGIVGTTHTTGMGRGAPGLNLETPDALLYRAEAKERLWCPSNLRSGVFEFRRSEKI